MGIVYPERSSKTCMHAKIVEIGSLEVEPSYRRNEYAEAAVRTVLEIFRAKLHEKLRFDRFWLTVGLGGDKKAPRGL